MALITVYFPGPRKAIIDETHKDYFLNLGAVETQAAAKPDEPEPDLNPDKGFGHPGSIKWHMLHLNGLKSKYAIWKYCREVTGKSVDRRKDIDGHMKQATELIREHINGNGK